MRRWLIAFLIVFLPLQLAWAAAAPYCQHEQVLEAGHVGHHDHEHRASADSGGDPGTSDTQSPGPHAKLGVDQDCGYCHLSAATAMAAQVPQPLVSLAVCEQVTAAHRLGTRDPDRHDRPNWCRA